MAELVVTLETLSKMDHGRPSKAINHALSVITRDLQQRGEDGKERTLTIKVKFKQKKNAPDEFMIRTTAGYTLPTLDTAETHARLTTDDQGKAELKFRPESPGNADQGELYDDADAEETDE